MEHFKFFSHKQCEYFPCHQTDSPETFNCLFCYCPLYVLGERCNGNFTYTNDGVKDCSRCTLPHDRNSWESITSRFFELDTIVRQVNAAHNALNDS